MPNPPFPRRYDCLHHGAGHAVYPNSALRAQEPGVGWEKVTGLAFDGAFITSDTPSGSHRGWHHDYALLRAYVNRIPDVQWCQAYRLLGFGGTNRVLSIGETDGSARCGTRLR